MRRMDRQPDLHVGLTRTDLNVIENCRQARWALHRALDMPSGENRTIALAVWAEMYGESAMKELIA